MSPTLMGMTARPDRSRRALGALVAAVALPFAVGAHLLTVGRLPAPGILAAALVLAVSVGAALAPRRATGRSLAVCAGAAQLAAHALLMLAPSPGAPVGCLPAVGRGASVGLRLALLRQDPGCAAGYRVGEVGSGLLTTLGVAVAILLGHALASGLTGWALAAWQRSRRAIAGCAGLRARVGGLTDLLVRVLEQPLGAATRAPGRARRREPSAVPLPAGHVPGAWRRRGPPVAVHA